MTTHLLLNDCTPAVEWPHPFIESIEWQQICGQMTTHFIITEWLNVFSARANIFLTTSHTGFRICPILHMTHFISVTFLIKSYAKKPSLWKNAREAMKQAHKNWPNSPVRQWRQHKTHCTYTVIHLNSLMFLSVQSYTNLLCGKT